MRSPALLAALLLASVSAAAQMPPVLDRLQRADGTQVLPDRFLRRWDPVTVLFPRDAGPLSGGPEDAPDRLVTLSPPKPGAWTWLGSRTLQFRPTEPWEPLRRETVALAGGPSTVLVPLLSPPTATGPSDPSNGTADLDTVSLTFPEPVDAAVLARLLTIELTPQGGGRAQVLAPEDYGLRAVERSARNDAQTYLVVLRRPVPDGQVATLRLRLSDAAGLDDPMFELALRSATPFRLADTYCGDGYGHSTVDGITVCDPSGAGQRRTAVLQFNAMPQDLTIVQARDLIRITPPVDKLAVESAGDNELRLTAAFAPGTTYEIAVAAGTLRDTRSRALTASVSTRVRFNAATPALAWDVPQGIVERLGPQMVPVDGHGYDRADVRVVPIDPLSRDFWPFPAAGLATNDGRSPPLPGREPEHYQDAGPIAGDEMAARIGALGTPAASELMPLPIKRGGLDAKFGLDLKPTLARIAGADAPGNYLVGLRAVDGVLRHWARIQVTDLVLTTVEDTDRVRFAVTSLSGAQPVAGAEIRLQGLRDEAFVTLAQGVTGADGFWTLAAPIARGHDGDEASLRRIVVTKADDTLVLEPDRGPKQYTAGGWSKAASPWLGWTVSPVADREPKPKLLCHVFTERPIYRPEEPVLIAGMIRRYRAGALSYAAGPGEVLVTGPGEQQWRLPVTLDEVGGFHVRFDAKTEATGDYGIQFQPGTGDAAGAGCGAITVKKEAYRLPTFEAVLTAPATVPLDAPFSVDLLARFFAGGLLSDRPVTWRVTQFPYAWSPPGRDGFLFSSDSRFSGDATFRSTPVLTRQVKTDAGGAAQLTLDPTGEPTAQPRTYLVEATVTGDDDQQVRGVQRVTALPPFVLGVKQDRYLPGLGAIRPQIVALDGQGKPVTGLPITVKLIHRQWTSTLQASDFAQGSAKYRTDVVDDAVAQREVTSGADPVAVDFGAGEAGVYVVEASAADKVGRTQTVKVDLFMAGDTPVTWQAPPATTVTLSTDKDRYDPGETATLLIQSPFQSGRALMVVEEPENRFRYDWVEIANGFGRYPVPIRKAQVPRLTVHALLMRGRLPGPANAAAPFDQGKPVTLAATAAIAVNPAENRVAVSFEAPAQARPAQEFDLVLHLSDTAGRPVAGEATVWMVDQAVLALAKEQPLDPLPAFIVDRPARMVARDTRNMAFGVIPLAEAPGGDEAGDFGMENITVRKNFTPVPLYVPRVKVGPDGTARVHVKLPDTLTVFMLRAEAVSGPDRFGFGTGQLRVRQPLVAQPALPRFVRPGDLFTAGLIGRIVEGPGGAGRALISLDDLAVQGSAEQPVAWDGQRPARTDFTISVPEPPLGTSTARVRFLLRRAADGVTDAVQVDLPIRPDRPPVFRQSLATVGAGGTLTLKAPAEPPRPATYAQTVTLATDPAVPRLLTGALTLTRPIVGGVEQRMALARGELALLPFTPLMDATGLRDRVATDVSAAIAAIRLATDDDGLVGFFPATPGTVWLTATAYRLLVQAGRAGLPVDKAQAERMAKVLTASLRSDYPHLISDAELFDRVSALLALADGGQLQPEYAFELARETAALRTGGVADVAQVLARLPETDRRLLPAVLDALWGRVNFLSRDGKPVYAGLVDRPAPPRILPSETRSLAQVVGAVGEATPDDPRLPVLRTALLDLAGPDGWGTTNATAAALEALASSWRAPAAPAPVAVALPDRRVAGTLDRAHPLLQARTTEPGDAAVIAPAGTAVLSALRYVPAPPGAAAQAEQHGFALTRTLYRVNGTGPMTRLEPTDGAIHLAVGDVVEEVAELVSDADRSQVALILPLAAGTEPLNPALASATADAQPSAGPTLAPSWSSYGDDAVTAVWLQLPRGTYTLRTRMRATIPGSFTEPPAGVAMLYVPGTFGSTGGARIEVTR